MSNIRSTLLAFAILLFATPVVSAFMLVQSFNENEGAMEDSACGSAYLGLFGLALFSFYPLAFGVWALIVRSLSRTIHPTAAWVQLVCIAALGVIPVLFWWIKMIMPV